MTPLEGARLLRQQALRKMAYVPLTPAAQDAMAAQPQPGMPPMPPDAGGMPPQGGGMPPMDPAAMGGGAPMPPGGDPAAMGGAPAPGGAPMHPGGGAPMPGGAPGGAPAGGPIQTVPGPPDPSTGQPTQIDPETGMIVIDPNQGMEMDMNTGIIFMKFTNEFYSNDGQPMDPNQAMQQIVEAAAGPVDPQQQQQDMADFNRMTQGGAPPQGGMPGGDIGGGAPPMPPVGDMGGGAPMPPDVMGGAPGGAPMPPPGGDMGGGMPPDMGGAPMPPDAGAMPPPGGDMGGMPPDMGGVPPPDAGMPPDVGMAAPMDQGAPPPEPAAPIDPAAAGMPMFQNTPEIQGTLAQLVEMQEDQARVQDEQQADIDAANKLSDSTNKVVKKLMESTNALRREVAAYHDNNEKLAAEIEALLDALGAGMQSAGRPIR